MLTGGRSRRRQVDGDQGENDRGSDQEEDEQQAADGQDGTTGSQAISKRGARSGTPSSRIQCRFTYRGAPAAGAGAYIRVVSE